MRVVIASLALPLVAACASSGGSPQPQANSARAMAQRDEGWSGSKLYARDGHVVSGAVDAPQDADGAAPRELAPSEGGRMYILELYQKAMDERDALQNETRALQSQLEQARKASGDAQGETQALRAEVERLTAENKRLLDENVELAARLTTAQIRRLQAEKILLEARLADLQSNAPATATAEAAGKEHP